MRIGASERSFWAVRAGRLLRTRGGGIEGTFEASGARLAAQGASVRMALTGIGGLRRLRSGGAVAPSANADEVIYRMGAIRASYSNGPYGLEQRFAVARPMTQSSTLVLALKLGGSLQPRQVGSQIVFTTGAGAVLRYGQLRAVDATGRQLSARMRLWNGSLRLEIDTHDARYPLRIDPFIQRGQPRTGSGEGGEGYFGASVALSADGSTALIGAPADDGGVGAAWVFTRSGSTWSQQGEKLTGRGELVLHPPPGQPPLGSEPCCIVQSDGFGAGVALSADGNTALIGAPVDDGGVGAAWVFTRSGSTWSQQGEKLTGAREVSGGFQGWFGDSVALSADGNTALIGASGDDRDFGAAWVFVRSGSTWSQQGEKLTGNAGSVVPNRVLFGDSVALSADGNTALVGGSAYNGDDGAAWIFRRSGSSWNQGEMLTGDGEQGTGQFGSSVALSANGETALIGGDLDNTGGAAWFLTRSRSSWTQQKLNGSGEIYGSEFGEHVALSADSNTALVAGSGAEGGTSTVWVFQRSGATWSQQNEKLTGTGESERGEFGVSVALSANGHTALIGGPYPAPATPTNNPRGTGAGAAWAFEDVTPTPLTTTNLTATPSIKIEHIKVQARGLAVAVRTSTKGTITISGHRLATKTVKALAAGSHLLSVAFTTALPRERKHPTSIKLLVRLRTATTTVSNSKEVKL